MPYSKEYHIGGKANEAAFLAIATAVESFDLEGKDLSAKRPKRFVKSVAFFFSLLDTCGRSCRFRYTPLRDCLAPPRMVFFLRPELVDRRSSAVNISIQVIIETRSLTSLPR